MQGPHGVRLSMSPGDFGPAHHLHPSRGPPPYDARWQPRGFEGARHCVIFLSAAMLERDAQLVAP